MSAVIPYEIWIPSRKRSGIIASTLELLPDAKVFVDEREADDYAEVVPEDQLVLHEPTRTNAEVWEALFRTCQSECLLKIDDDLRSVWSLTGKKCRKYTDPAVIRQILENGINLAADLGVPLFGWNRNANPMQFFASDPVGMVGPIAGATGIIGREIWPDTGFVGCIDVDLTMQALLDHRLALCDRRFYFDFGGVWSGKGGNQGVRTWESDEADRKRLEHKWGDCIRIRKSGNSTRSEASATYGMSIRVKRKSQLASTR